MLFLFISCKDSNENLVSITYDPENIPTLITKSTSTLISDSGITRYRIVADEWLVFDKAKDPYQLFPSGAYLERFTPSFEIEATVEADTAWYFMDKDLWRLKNNVHIENMDGDQFDTEEMFMDQANDRVYSDKYIVIKRGETRLKGYGFESNLQMTNYRIFKPHEGLLPFADDRNSQTNDTVFTNPEDSIFTNPDDSILIDEIQLNE